ncbi:peptidoglycan DD-metalloendopeptidase family protein [Streptomyces sp. KL116D]|uniref:peptidoglycan DD-metalloendopeptidase family protein n=1 Tax=Streptomyces sp. KL116D TaxID=3045152 RepID=UPI0035571758
MSNGARGTPADQERAGAAYRRPARRAAGVHAGVDFAVPTGRPVRSIAPGTVVTAGNQGAKKAGQKLRLPGE